MEKDFSKLIETLDSAIEKLEALRLSLNTEAENNDTYLLEPCPQCDNKLPILRNLGECFEVICERCGEASDFCETPGAALDYWNRRN